MPTEAEEIQAKDFLKRAEIKTMKKDLKALREVDALKERDKIATIKTLEEQQAEHHKKMEEIEKAKTEVDKTKRADILQKTAKEEYAAERDLKNYATEEERQQIFLLESQRLSLGTQFDKINKENDPALKLEKNSLLIQITTAQAKLTSVLENEKKLEDEQKFIIEKEHTSAVPSEKKGLEQRRGDIEKEIQDIEKTRWAVEKQIQDLEAKVKGVNQSSELLVIEKNTLRDKVLGIDKSLREIYSGVIARVQERRRGEAEEQKIKKVSLEKARAEKNEKVQREQWSGKAQIPQKGFLNNAPTSLREKLAKGVQAEEEQRKKFLQDIEQEANQNVGQQQQKSNIK